MATINFKSEEAQKLNELRNWKNAIRNSNKGYAWGVLVANWDYSDYYGEKSTNANCYDKTFFLTEEEARIFFEEKKSETVDSGEVNEVRLFNIEFDFDDVEDIMNYDDFEDICSCWYSSSKTDDIEEEVIEYQNYENIEGSIIVEWSWERYPGYCRNLKQIGIAGQYPFHEFKTEEDLFTGNEERTFHSNYSVLLSEKEVEEATDLREAIEEKLNDRNWKWNYFKNNPSSHYIDDLINEICENI